MTEPKLANSSEEDAERNQRQHSSALLVLGMHRSGTSMVTGVLKLCGAWLGEETEMTGSNTENPRGFFERRDLRSICDNLLHSARADWWLLSDFRLGDIPENTLEEEREIFSRLVAQLSAQGNWAIKEPRLCILLPVLESCIPSPVCIIPVRNPIEIAKSLRKRNGISLQQGVALWEVYVRSALRASASKRRVLVNYSDLVDDPRGATERLVLELSSVGVEKLSFHSSVSEFISPDLYRETASNSDLDLLLDAGQKDLWVNLLNRRMLVEEGQRDISERTRLILKDLEALYLSRSNLIDEMKNRDASLRTLRREMEIHLEKVSKEERKTKERQKSQDETILALRREVLLERERVAEGERGIQERKNESRLQGDAIAALNRRIAERNRLLQEARDEVERRRSGLSDVGAGLILARRELFSDLDDLQRKLRNARLRPVRSIGRKLASPILYKLSKLDQIFSSERRARFLRSAQKRDPRRNEVQKVKENFFAWEKGVRVLISDASGGNFSVPAAASESGASSYQQTFVSEVPISIIVPVYNASDDLEQCIARLSAFAPENADILFIDDASSDPKVTELLALTASDPRMRVLRNPRNMGFTRTVNRGFAETGERDVIILNSDARVTPRWVEGMLVAANSAPKIATVTPMSDRAGAFSAPEIGNNNILPPGVDEVTYARAFRRRGLGRYPAVPTGNGFCMYISRSCLNEVGLLDEEAFPRGYGEENDFCMRALRAGWLNVIDDCTYVFHDRSKSFGESKSELVSAGRAVIDERYPEYKKAISIYRESPDILAARSEAYMAMQDCSDPEASNPRILYVISTLTGGTPQTNSDLMSGLASSVTCFLFRCDSRKLQLWHFVEGQQVLLKVHDLTEPVDPVTHLSSEYDGVVSSWLTSLDIDLVHIRHVGWHSLSLPEIARREGRAVVMSFHDYYALCPTVKLLDRENAFCGGTCTAAAGDCRIELWPRDSMPPLKDAWVHVWRRRFDKALASCDALITTSDAARSRLMEHLPSLARERFWTIPHGRDFPVLENLRERPEEAKPLRILVPGNLNEAKGLEIIQALLEYDKEGMFEFHVLGRWTGTGLVELGERGRLVQHGRYLRDDFPRKVAEIRPHFGAVFSIWDETWCHTLTEMWSVGLPVAVFDFPTVAARVRQSGAGWVLGHNDIPQLAEELNRLARDPEEFARTQSALADWQAGEALAGNTRWMAVDYFDVYRQALVRRRRPYGPDGTSGVAEAIGEPAVTSASPRLPRVAVVGPSNPSQTRANGSTEVRLWERTRNSFDRSVTFVRMGHEELLATVRTGALDAAIIQRDVIPQAVADDFIVAFKEANTPYIFDIDDDLLDVPKAKDPKGEYAAYAPTLRQLLSAATMVTVSTPALKARLGHLAMRVEIVPNRLSGRLWRGLGVDRSSDDFVRALYMGSMTHAGDLELIAPAFEKVAAANPKFRLAVIGVAEGELPSWAERIAVPAGVKAYHRFVPWLRGQSRVFDFAIAPLETSPFNACKSPLKILECGALGLPVLASDHPVFREIADLAPGVRLVSDDTDDWVRALEAQIAAGRGDGADLRAWVLKNYVMEASLPEFDAMIRSIIGDCARGSSPGAASA